MSSARSSRSWLCLLCVLFTGALATWAEEKGVAGVTEGVIQRERPRRWAVLIGVNHYVDESGIGELDYCVADMNLLAGTLTSQAGGFELRNVLLMTDEAKEEIHRPTRDNLVTQVPHWLEQAEPDDDVLIAFSGHGIIEGNKGYLLPSTARMLNVRLTAIPLETVREWLDSCKAGRKILILDCCHAGAGKAVGKMDGRLLAEIQKGEGFVRLASCREEEKSNEDRELGHGIFTYYLCEGLAGNADFDLDGRIDVDEAYRYAFGEVRYWAHRKGLRQNPVKSGEVEGSITLGYSPDKEWVEPGASAAEEPPERSLWRIGLAGKWGGRSSWWAWTLAIALFLVIALLPVGIAGAIAEAAGNSALGGFLIFLPVGGFYYVLCWGLPAGAWAWILAATFLPLGGGLAGVVAADAKA